MDQSLSRTSASRPADAILVEVSHLSFTPIKLYDDLVGVTIYSGDGYSREISHVNRGVDGRYSLIGAPEPMIQLHIPPSLDDIKIVVQFLSSDHMMREIERRSKSAVMPLREVLFVRAGMSDTTPCTIKLEDGTIMGTLDLRLAVLRLTFETSDLPDIRRKTQIPMLQYIKDILDALTALQSFTEHHHHCFYDTVLAIYAALWVLWRRSLNRKVLEHSPNGPNPDPRIIAAIMATQDNALEDLVLQCHRQFDLIVQCFEVLGTTATNHIKLLTSVLEAAAESAVIVYQWAGKHPHVTWEHLDHYALNAHHGTDEYRAVYRNATQDMERLHLQFLSISYEVQQITREASLPPLPASRDDLLRFLYERALQESWEQVNKGPYTSTFECILGPQVGVVFDWMMKDFEQPDNSVKDRDASRRLITHLAQRSGRLPDSMVLADVRYHHEPNRAPLAVGGGSFADVYKGIHCDGDDHSVVAMKVLRMNIDVEMQRRRRQMYLEVLTCHTLDHPNILRILGVARGFPSLTIVTPWMNNGNVLTYLARISADYPVTPIWLLHKWINNIAQGLAYLHREGMAHGDLRGVNILIDDNEVARIADFGLAVYLNGHSRNYASMRSGSVQWHAPEILRPQGKELASRPTPAADVYSFSHVCIELYTSGLPYPDLADDKELALGPFIDRLMDPNDALRPARPAQMSDILWGMLQRYWCTDPLDRPTSADVVSDVSILHQQPGT